MRARRAAVALVACGALLAACAPPTSAPDAQGPDGSRRLVWAQEFDGPAGSPDPTQWKAMDLAGGWGNDELQAYTPRRENVTVDGDGLLRITARREAHVDPAGDRADYTSARLETVDTFVNGRIEARMNVPAGQGLWSAFWTLGIDHWTVGWPRVGEIDVIELLGDARTAHGGIHAFSDDGGRWHDQGTVDADEDSFAGTWHVYGIEWTAQSIAFLIDGEEFHRVTRDELSPGEDWPFERPQHLIVNLAVGGTWPGPPDDTTAFPAELLVDWIRVYDSTVRAG